MEQPNPATPAQAATPGNGENGNQPAAAGSAPAVTPGQGNQSAGTVTIPTAEYAELQRAKARSLSFDRRKGFRSQSANANPGDPADNVALAEANSRALKAEVTLKVRDILEKPEYSSLPASTKALILRNPAMLSDADNLDDALADIEEFVSEEAAVAKATSKPNETVPGQGGGDRTAPAGHEAPQIVSAGAPAPTAAVELEDVSKLTGSARSRAVLRNSLKKSGGMK